MSTSAHTRLPVAISALALLAIPLTACSGDDSSGDMATSSSSSSSSHTSGAAPTSPGDQAGATATTANAGVTATTTVSGADGGGDQAGGAGGGHGSGPNGDSAPPAPDHGGSAPVDPAAFQSGDGFFFLSPDSGAHCAIFGDGAAGNYSAGCQGEMPPPPELPDCVGGGAANVAVWLGADGAGGTECFTQGIFVSEPTSRGEQVLQPGQTLAARGYTCTASDSAVTCNSDASGRGFTASGAGVQLVG